MPFCDTPSPGWFEQAMFCLLYTSQVMEQDAVHIALTTLKPIKDRCDFALIACFVGVCRTILDHIGRCKALKWNLRICSRASRQSAPANLGVALQTDRMWKPDEPQTSTRSNNWLTARLLSINAFR